jgi:NAD(P)H-dependent FMN reductase
MDTNRPIFIPVILGTSRQGRMSEHVAKFVVEEVAKRDGVETELIDIRKFRFPPQMRVKPSKTLSFLQP